MRLKLPICSDDTVLKKYLPHTITRWVTQAICLSEIDGPGISPQIELTVSQPFFVDILLPYSLKRGETLYLQVIVFNYLNYSLPVSISYGEGYHLSN